MDEVRHRTSLAPLASPCLILSLLSVEAEGPFSLPGEGGDHFHCAVEPSSGHIRCRGQNNLRLSSCSGYAMRRVPCGPVVVEHEVPVGCSVHTPVGVPLEAVSLEKRPSCSLKFDLPAELTDAPTPRAAVPVGCMDMQRRAECRVEL